MFQCLTKIKGQYESMTYVYHKFITSFVIHFLSPSLKHVHSFFIYMLIDKFAHLETDGRLTMLCLTFCQSNCSHRLWVETIIVEV